MPDPYLILGVASDADDEAIRAAYLAAVKACPPERDPARFVALREAYEAIGNRRARLAHELFDIRPPTVEDVLERAAPVEVGLRPELGLFAALLRGQE